MFSRITFFVATLTAFCGLLTEPAHAQSEGETLHALIDEIWEFRLQNDPLLATRTGDRRFNDLLPRVSIDQVNQEQTADKKFLERLEAIDKAKLVLADRINYDILRRLLKTRIAETDFDAYLIPITNREGFHISFPELRRLMPLRTEKDFRNYIARLRGFQGFAQDHIKVMREGIQQGFTLPSVVLTSYRDPLEVHLVEDPKTSLFYEPLRKLPNSIPEEQKQELRRAAESAIRDGIVPGYRDFLKFMQDEYVPSARSSIGASALPNGREFYRHRVRRFTTLEITPQEVHNVGLEEVKRIRSEMQKVIEEIGFEGDLRQFITELREDERFHPKSAEHLMKEVTFALKRMDGQLPLLFKTLPRTPYGIQKIPDYIAPQTTTAYYQPPPGDGSRAGFYFVNTYDLKSRPLYEVEALSYHEAVPGHHLQIALQQELENLPTFRRFAGFTAFVEGWALYSERLGLELGFYSDPYSNFGRLTYEMWRACRLVVDTGMHYLGWTRQQAINFMADNTALSMHNIRSEVDRYIAWPGQALGYKIGELTIRELRKKAENELKGQFDVREFHDVVLLQGSVPLDVLTRQVESWIEEVKTADSP